MDGRGIELDAGRAGQTYPHSQPPLILEGIFFAYKKEETLFLHPQLVCPKCSDFYGAFKHA